MPYFKGQTICTLTYGCGFLPCRMCQENQLLLYRVEKASKFHPKTQVL